MTTIRRHDIDWLRVIAIWLLLVYHIAIIFQPWAMFIGFIRSDQTLESLWKLMSLLNVWRIPLLFYISGMGVYFAIRKRTWRELLLERSKRIFLPFIFGAIAIVPLQFLLFQGYYQLPLEYQAHPAHLWFLGNIFCYVLIFSPLFFFLKRIQQGSFNKALSRFMSYPVGPLSVSIFFMLETILVKPLTFELYAQTWHGFFLGLLAFFFGFLFMYSGSACWKTMLHWRWLYLVIGIILYGIRLVVFNLKAPDYLMALESNSWILAIFGFGYKYLNKPGAVLSYLSQAAYPIYIIHMFVMYAVAMIILPIDIPVILKLIAIIGFTIVLCYGLYELFIRRFTLLGPLFGLKWRLSTPNKQKNVPVLSYKRFLKKLKTN